VLPDRLVPLEETLAAPDVVDQDVEPSALHADPRDQRLDLARHEMVDADRDPAPRTARAARHEGDLARE
jgi:hypothetical protein